jgi:preprotein translocase subunit SecG
MKDMIKVTMSLVVIFIAAGLIMGLTYMKTCPVYCGADRKKGSAPEACTGSR